jgi:hypothetical protein
MLMNTVYLAPFFVGEVLELELWAFARCFTT